MSSSPLKRYRVIRVRSDSGALEDFLVNYESDEQAIENLRSIFDHMKWELWEGNRRIAASEMPVTAMPTRNHERKFRRPN